MSDDRWQCGKTLLESIEFMLTSETASDVTFLLGEDKKKVLAHKFILVSRSPVFYAMLEGQLAERDDIHVTDISEDIFSIFLRYLYTDIVDISIENIAALLYVSRKYLVDTLTNRCEKFLRKDLTPENVCYVMEKMHEFPDDKLKDECHRIVEEDSSKILKSEMFAELCPTCLQELISSDDLPVDEMYVYSAVMRWAGAECERQGLTTTDANRRDVLGDILYEVRFPVIDAHYFSKTVFKHTVLTNDELVEIHRFIYSDEKGNNLKLGKFNCKQRVRCRKGRYKEARREFRLRSIDGFAYWTEFDDHFSCKPVRPSGTSGTDRCELYFKPSADVFLHGVITAKHNGTVQIDVKNASGEILYCSFDSPEDNQKELIQFRKILSIKSNAEYSISLRSVSEPRLQIAKHANIIHFGSIRIQFRKSDFIYDDDANSVDCLSGFLLS